MSLLSGIEIVEKVVFLAVDGVIQISGFTFLFNQQVSLELINHLFLASISLIRCDVRLGLANYTRGNI